MHDPSKTQRRSDRSLRSNSRKIRWWVAVYIIIMIIIRVPSFLCWRGFCRDAYKMLCWSLVRCPRKSQESRIKTMPELGGLMHHGSMNRWDGLALWKSLLGWLGSPTPIDLVCHDSWVCMFLCSYVCTNHVCGKVSIWGVQLPSMQISSCTSRQMLKQSLVTCFRNHQWHHNYSSTS